MDGLAHVQDDGSLRIAGRTIRLFGIYIPQGDRSCRTVIQPVRCAPKAVLVLEGKVRGFVRCEIVRPGEGICSVRGDDGLDSREDLGGFLLEEGFALARPDAPSPYPALERLAQAQERGLWSTRTLNLR